MTTASTHRVSYLTLVLMRYKTCSFFEPQSETPGLFTLVYNSSKWMNYLRYNQSHKFLQCVCVRGGPHQPLHRDLQWSIVLNSYNGSPMQISSSSCP
jgi:hypothetical protein